jgi:hypothetical protein
MISRVPELKKPNMCLRVLALVVIPESDAGGGGCAGKRELPNA